MLELVPITTEKEEEEEAYNFLINAGFDNEDLKIIKDHYDKEGVKFCIKTFNAISIEEMKDDLKNYKNKSAFKKCKKVFVNLKISISGICR